MNKELEIIRQYEKTGFCERMHLFLQFRDLRDIFQELEFNRSEEVEQVVSSADQPKNSKYPWLLSLFKRNREIKASKEGEGTLPDVPELIEQAPLGRPSC